MLKMHNEIAGLNRNISPHQLRHFLFTWLKTQGVDDALIQSIKTEPVIPHPINLIKNIHFF